MLPGALDLRLKSAIETRIGNARKIGVSDLACLAIRKNFEYSSEEKRFLKLKKASKERIKFKREKERIRK